MSRTRHPHDPMDAFYLWVGIVLPIALIPLVIAYAIITSH